LGGVQFHPLLLMDRLNLFPQPDVGRRWVGLSHAFRSLSLLVCLLFWLTTHALAQQPTPPVPSTVCDYNTAPATVSLTAQNVPAGYATTYLLVDLTTGLIASTNTSAPVFTGVAQGSYYVVAAHNSTTATLGNAQPGKRVVEVNSSDGCVVYSNTVGIRVCPASVPCDYSTAPATLSFVAGNVPNGATTQYVLIDRSTNLIARVSGGAAFTGVAAGDYAVCAVHYTTPAAAPSVGTSLYSAVNSSTALCVSVSNPLYYKVCETPVVPPSVVISSPGNTTATTTPLVSGTATPGSLVTIFGPNNTTLCSTTAAPGSGTYACAVSVSAGPTTLTATACLSGSCASAIASFTAIAPVTCATTSVGGVVAYAGGALCPGTNAGTLTLTSQVGSVVKWQTSTNGGSSWSDIASTNTYLNFFNAQNGQQYRAIVNNGGICGDALSSVVTLSTNAAACSSTVCDNSAATIAVNITSGTLAVGQQQVLIATDATGTVQYVGAAGASSLTGVANGDYTVYLVTYDPTFAPAPMLSVGTSLSNVGGGCINYSNAVPYKVCPALLPPTVVVLSPANNGTATTSPTVSGTATPGSLVTISGPGGVTLCSTTAAVGSGTYTCAVSVPTGPNTLTVTACNTAGCASVQQTFTAVAPPSLTVVQPPAGGSTQLVSGTGTPGSTIAITDPNGATLCATTVSASGTFACPVSVTTGVTTLTITACNGAGCINAPIALTVVQPASVTVVPNTPGGSTQLVSGTATPGSIVSITDPNGATLCSTTATATGTFSCPVSVTTGVTPLTVTACNAAGCTSGVLSVTNLGPPTVVILVPAPGGLAGITPVVSGTATPGSSVTVSGPNGQIVVVITNPAGQWTTPPGSITFAPGAGSLTVVAGNAGGISVPVSVSFTVQLIPTVTILTPTQSGTATATLTVGGFATAGSTITLVASNGQSVTVVASAGGLWSVPGLIFGPGVQSLTAITSNGAGVSVPSIITFFVSIPPTVTIITPTQSGTAPASPTIFGVATPGSSLTIYGNPGSVGGPVVVIADPNGFWAVTSLTFTAGMPGSVTVVAGNLGGISVPVSVTFNVPGAALAGTSIPVKVMLQGSLVRSSVAVTASGLMRDDLRVRGLLPMTEPYTTLGYVHANGGGGETISNPGVLTVTGSNAIVDWVVVELHTVAPGGTGSTVVATRAGLVQADGDVVGMDGLTPIVMNTASLTGTAYHVAVHHRNHLGIMTANPIAINATTLNVPVIDFTAAPTAYTLTGMLASVPTTVERGIRCLWAGNTSGIDPNIPISKRSIRAQGQYNDVDPIFFAIMIPANTGGFSNYVRSGVYLNTDVDMNGDVIFQGGLNEVDIILYNVLSHPSNAQGFANYIIQEQKP
jgi:hypothetical protein